MRIRVLRGISIAIAFALILFATGCRSDRAASEPAPADGSQSAARDAATTPSQGAEPAPESTSPAAPAQSEKRPAAKPREAARRADAVARTGAAASAGNEAPARRAEGVVLETGTVLRVRTTSALSSKTHAAGDVFEASLAEPVVADGREVLPRGAAVKGRIVDSEAGGRVKGTATISLALTSVAAGAQTLPVTTSVVAQQARSSTKKDAAKVGIGAGVGAAIGAIAGGGKGAALGAAAGGGAGTAAVLATRGDAAVVPAESVLTFELSKPVTLR